MAYNDFAVRFIAYAPDGPNLGVLPDVFDYNFSNVVNDIPSLTFKYSRLGVRAYLLDNPVEVAVEWFNGSSWVEAANSRFIKISTDEDEVDETGTVTYTMPGYGWMLGKAIMRAGLTRNPDNQKRKWTGVSPGVIMRTLIDEAHARGNIPSLLYDFAGSYDTAGKGWQFPQLAFELDRGTTLETVIKMLSDQGRCDWRFQGRALEMYNPESQSISTAHVLATRTQTVIDVGAVVTDWKSHVDGELANGQVPSSYRGALEADFAAFAGQGDVLTTQSRMVGVNGQQNASNRQIGVLRSSQGPDEAGVTRSFGALIADWTTLPRICWAVPDMTGGSVDDLGIEECAVQAYVQFPGSVLSLPGTGPVMYGDVQDGFHCQARALMARGLPYVEFDTFSDGSAPNADIVLQLGVARSYSRVQQMQALRAFLPSNWRVVIDYVSEDPNKTNEDWWLLGAPDLKDDTDPTKGRQDPDVIVDGLGYKAISRDGELKSLPNLRSAEARHYGVPYMRVLVKNSWTGSGQAHIANQIGVSIANVFAYLPSRLPRVGRRSITNVNAPETPNVSVTIFNGRDATQAPTKSSIADFARRVYVFGDPVLETVLTNDLAPAPWGNWEVGIGQGGNYELNSLYAMGQYALDAGSYMKLERTRMASVNECPFVPYRDYEPGDYVLISTHTGARETARVQQITITADEGLIMVSLTLNDRFIEPELRTAGAIKSAAAGSYPNAASTAGSVSPGGTGTSAADANYVDPAPITQDYAPVNPNAPVTSVTNWCSDDCPCRSMHGGGNYGPGDVQVFTADGTWKKPANLSPTAQVTVYLIGGGGGGTGGVCNQPESSNSTDKVMGYGGAGGGGGGYTKVVMAASGLDGQVEVKVGKGGLGRPGQRLLPGTTTTDPSYYDDIENVESFMGGDSAFGPGLFEGRTTGISGAVANGGTGGQLFQAPGGHGLQGSAQVSGGDGGAGGGLGGAYGPDEIEEASQVNGRRGKSTDLGSAAGGGGGGTFDTRFGNPGFGAPGGNSMSLDGTFKVTGGQANEPGSTRPGTQAPGGGGGGGNASNVRGQDGKPGGQYGAGGGGGGGCELVAGRFGGGDGGAGAPGVVVVVTS